MLYAIEAVLDIAYHAGNAPVRSQEITRRQGIPKRYLEQALQHLVHSNILIGVRGPHGGYRLARERRRITIGDIVVIIRNMESTEQKEQEVCESQLGQQVVRPLLNELQDSLMVHLDGTTIDDLCNRAVSSNIDSEGRQNLDFTI
jgi:Rrf2 family iron-sulfur cluster assembly transcriptional regulator